MPTGYTAGIIDGSIKDFKQFATLCMRAFGATIHMRDEDLSAEYEPRTPSGYHEKSIAAAEQTLKEANDLPDETIVEKRRTELLQSKEYHLKQIEVAKHAGERLASILAQAEAYVPPTSEHTGIRDFMIQQLTETIRFDGSTEYNEKELARIEDELKNISAQQVRDSMREKAYKDLAYHTKELNKEIDRCNTSNEWVSVYLKSLAQDTAA